MEENGIKYTDFWFSMQYQNEKPYWHGTLAQTTWCPGQWNNWIWYWTDIETWIDLLCVNINGTADLDWFQRFKQGKRFKIKTSFFCYCDFSSGLYFYQQPTLEASEAIALYVSTNHIYPRASLPSCVHCIPASDPIQPTDNFTQHLLSDARHSEENKNGATEKHDLALHIKSKSKLLTQNSNFSTNACVGVTPPRYDYI